MNKKLKRDKSKGFSTSKPVSKVRKELSNQELSDQLQAEDELYWQNIMKGNNKR